MNEELKPCPFCGGPAESQPEFVNCRKCNARVHFWDGSPASAWNSRANNPADIASAMKGISVGLKSIGYKDGSPESARQFDELHAELMRLSALIVPKESNG